MPNGSRIEHLCDLIPKAQSWMVLNLPVFMFVYIHFNVSPTRITDLVRNVSDKKIYWYGTVAFVYVLAFIKLVCVQWVTLHLSLLYYHKRLVHFFFNSDCCPRLWNCNFLCIQFVYKPIFSVIFCWIRRMHVSSHFNSLFIRQPNLLVLLRPFSTRQNFLHGATFSFV